MRRVKAFVALASSFPAFEISFVACDATSSNIRSLAIRIENRLMNYLHTGLKKIFIMFYLVIRIIMTKNS